MTKKKWLYLLLILVITTPILFVFFSFSGNPLSKWQAKKVASAYLAEQFPDGQYQFIKGGGYNFKDKSYVIDYKRNNWEARLEVGRGFWPDDVILHNFHYDYTDLEKNDAISTTGSEYLNSLIKDVRYINYHAQVPQDFVVNDWKPNMPFEIKPNIYIELLQADRTKEAFLDEVITIQNILSKQNFVFERANVYSTTSSEIDGGTHYETQYEVDFTPTQHIKLDDISGY